MKTKRFLYPLELLILCAMVFSAQAAEVWISPKGHDQDPGTEVQPVKTLSRGMEILRQNRSESGLPSAIHILPGRYPVSETVVLNQADSGTPEAPLLIEGVNPPQDPAAPDSERTVLAGSEPIAGWQKSSFRHLSNVWEADLTGTAFDAPQGENPPKSKNLFLNGRRLSEAR